MVKMRHVINTRRIMNDIKYLRSTANAGSMGNKQEELEAII